ncbi:MscS Mechanosensitive ion channel [Dethiosulfovibrio peptidovorans DSM 11002]|uniref:MscS Mechanosensitive ion channel n=1 Tax=Dethiosulfovibrio peptidovorans DSM 11002 TaxID=469381 RepID=D2Z7G1_9BACT|nr:mechanosensitive ion channel domain-containing protein [Dethiosulfovibrio peptidovorans]EFC91408.1 MscS Mechanosensitive ion channel [Dethiosulfovibrio peptidovorans DSM 11002]
MRKTFLIFVLLLSFTVFPEVSDGNALTAVVKEGAIGETQGDPASGDSSSGDIYDVAKNENRIAELDRSIGTWASVPVAESAARYGVSEADVEDRITVLSSLQNFYKRLNGAVEKTVGFREDLKKRESEKGQARLSLKEEPPYKLSFYDEYLANADDLSSKLETLEESIAREQKAIVSARSQLDEAGKDLRLAQSELDKAKGTEEENKKLWAFQKAQVNEELWKVTLAYLERNLENLRLQRDAARLRLGQAEDVKKYIYSNVSFDEGDMKAGLARYEEGLKALQKKVEVLGKDIPKAEDAYAEAHAKLSAATGDKAVKEAQRVFSMAEIEREYLHLTMEQAQEMVGFLNEMKDIWMDRYDLLKPGGASADILLKQRDEVEQRIGRFEDVLISQQKYQAALHARSIALSGELDQAKDKVVVASLKRRSKILDDIMSQNMNYMVSLITLDTMNKRLLEEIKSHIKEVAITEKVSSMWRARTAEILNTELWHMGGYAVRLREFVIALVVLSFGLMASRRIAKFIRKWLLIHSKRVDVTGVHAIERLIYYFLICGSFLIALKVVNVPLTAFAFLGGAVAIGIGFGAQNLFNNLISGFILMVQQPFKINDIVQVDDITATVLEIDSRSTKIRTFDNYDVLVPNSYFLDNRITNWTLSDKIIRGKLEIGVAYGTPARKVEEILLGLARDHQTVLPDPKPFVLFSEYADSSMNFVLYFWVNVKNGFPTGVASDMRYRIQEIFEKEGIEIPFPQVDVHMEKSGVGAPDPV